MITTNHSHKIACHHCNEVFEERDLIKCDNEMLCVNCSENAGWKCCHNCEDYFNRDSIQVGADSKYYCDACFEEYFVFCSHCDIVDYCDDCCVYNGEIFCSDCFNNIDRCFNPAGFKGSNSYCKMTSQRRFGIELETAECENYTKLEGDRAWGAKDDNSVSGKEFWSDILYGDDGLAAIERICDFADFNDWSVDSRCGFHAHFDMRDESTNSLKAIALAYLLTYDIWNKFVNSRRVSNYYCCPNGTNSTEIYDITDWEAFANYQPRYEWINFSAYKKYRTFEVRLHHGTLDSKEICNWVKAHANFMDWASKAGWNVVRNSLLCKDNAEKFDFLSKVWSESGCEDLGEYYHDKARSNNADWVKLVAYT